MFGQSIHMSNDLYRNWIETVRNGILEQYRDTRIASPKEDIMAVSMHTEAHRGHASLFQQIHNFVFISSLSKYNSVASGLAFLYWITIICHS